MKKYTIEIKFNNGQVSSHQADKIEFHAGQGGIDIFEDFKGIPFFPGRENEISKIKVYLNWNK